MGWDVELNAIPADCDLLRAVARQEIDAVLLASVPAYFRMRRKLGCRVDTFALGDRGRELFVDAVENLVSCHPGIDQRYCNLSRRFDWLKWLLQRCSRDQDSALAATAIQGESQVTPAARSVQGFPIRWTSPSTCELLDIWLSELERSDLQSHYDPARMRDAHLYKWEQQTDTQTAFESIVEDFTSLKKLYRGVAINAEAVLVVAD